MTIGDVGRTLKEHIPEILTGISVACTFGSNVWTLKATEKYVEDKDKKHFIGPAVMAGIGAASAIGSDCLHVKGKAVLLASLAGSAALNVRQRQELEKRMTPEEMAKFDGIQNARTMEHSDKVLIYMPQIGYKFWTKPIPQERINRAESQLNKFFDSDGQFSLEDVFQLLGLESDAYSCDEDPIAARHMLWTFDWDSDEEQGVRLEFTPTTLCGVDCIRFKIIQYGSHWNSFDVPPQKKSSI